MNCCIFETYFSEILFKCSELYQNRYPKGPFDAHKVGLTHLLGEIGNGTPTVHMACFNVQKKTAKLGSWSSILGFYPGFTMFTPITTPFGPRWKDYILNRDDSGVVGELWR